MSHPVVWFEVMGKDGDSLRSFYSGLFGWKIAADNPMNYGMVEASGGRGIAGGVGQFESTKQAEDGSYPSVTFYVATESIDDSLAQAKKLGGKVVMERTKLPGGTVLGMFSDPEGNAIGLVEDGAA
ncbi:MAG: VOC family protein [Candidatus Eisenbacteria bacterium]|nr:VOC family protein [Candidatus Eisenbacteria bacterium]